MIIINAGTISVDVDSTSVTGSGTNWASTVKPGDELIVGQGFGFVASVASDIALTLAAPWSAGSVVDGDYYITQTGVGHDTIETNRLLRELTERLAAGAYFKPDAAGILASRAGYDDEGVPFAFIQTDVDPHKIYLKLSAASGDWSPGAEWFPKGDKGQATVVNENGADGPFDVTGALTQNGQQVYHLGNAGGLMTKQNLLINGGFTVWQRGPNRVLAAGGYGPDRWKFSGNCTVTRVTDTPDAITQYAMSVSTNNWTEGVVQIIEDGAELLLGETITVSFWAKGPINKTAQVEIGYGDSSDLFAFTGAWQRVEFETTITAQTALDSPDGHLYLHVVSNGGGTLANGDTVILSNAVLHVGSSGGVDPYKPRLFSEELNLCMRYFQKSHDYTVIPGSPTGVNSGAMLNSAHDSGRFGVFASFQVAMRSPPTLTLFDHNGASGAVTYFNGSWIAGGATSVAVAAEKGLYIQSNIAGAIYTAYAFSVEAEL